MKRNVVHAMNNQFMNTLTISRRRASYALAVALVFACQVAEACPGCKQGVGGDGAGGSFQTNGKALGYALSIGMLLFLVVGLISVLGYLAYRNCQILAAQQRALLEAEEFGQNGIRA